MGTVVAFRIWGEIAHFRRFFTTSSPLTFSFPPPPTVRGIVGALLGYGKEEYIRKTNDLAVGIKINSPVKKLRTGLNIIYTKGKNRKFDPTLFKDRKGDGKTPRTQVGYEFLKDPDFTLFILGEEEKLSSISDYLKSHKTEYTISLGLSECLADFRFEGAFEVEKVEESAKVSTVIPAEKVVSLELTGKVMKERIPTALNENREAVEFKDAIFNPDGGELKGKFKDVWLLKERGEFIYLFTFPS
ncbi:type I-B CRISPR-associated protein Cas5b [Thermovibrio sp.]